MKTILIAFATFLASISCAYAGDEWDTTDKALAVAAATVVVIDWRQTQFIAKNPLAYGEHNQFLGHHPTMGTVNLNFIADAIVIGVVADYLPSNYRKAWLSGVFAVELIYVNHNRGIGIRIGF